MIQTFKTGARMYQLSKNLYRLNPLLLKPFQTRSFPYFALHQFNMKQTILLAFTALALVLSSCKKESTGTNPTPTPPVTPTQPADNDHILLGNPTNATTNAAIGSNYFKDNVYYKIAYNSARGIPVWVSWHLQSSDIGSTPRQDDFRPDALPSSYYAVTTSSYSNSGFDRGHNCPSGDRTSTVAANSSTFLMTNMIPQAPMLNQGPWEGLEDYTRNTLVGTANEAYIIMGNYGTGGRGSSGSYNEIDNGNVTVPKMVWKVVVVIPKGSGDLARMDTTAKVVVVNMPNDNTLYSTTATGKNAWRNYITTINDLEAASATEGVTLSLLSSVNATVRTYLKQKRYY
jgi:endonuclease G, mitochondrial